MAFQLIRDERELEVGLGGAIFRGLDWAKVMPLLERFGLDDQDTVLRLQVINRSLIWCESVRAKQKAEAAERNRKR